VGHDLPTRETHIDLHVVEATAKRVFELLGDELAERDRGPVLEDAHQTAERFSLSKRWVYEHAKELGVIRVGEGDRPRLRFDPHIVRQRIADLAQPHQPTSAQSPAHGGSRRSASLLPVVRRRRGT